MGHGYRSNYSRRRFRMRYATTCKQPHGLRQVRVEYIRDIRDVNTNISVASCGS